MKSHFLSFAILFVGPFLFGQTPSPMSGSSRVVVVKFVAPPYPRAAKERRMMGKAVSEISVGPDGSVQDVRMLSAHPVFENPVRDALKRWRFSPPGGSIRCRLQSASSSMTLVKAQINIQSRRNPVSQQSFQTWFTSSPACNV